MKLDDLVESRFMQNLIKPLVPKGLRKSVRNLRLLMRGEYGYLDVQWGRVTYIEHWNQFLDKLPTQRLSLLEISPGPVSMWRERSWASYTSVQYPSFDITKQRLPEKFDVVIAEQVFEHLRHPYAAARNALAMLKSDGVFLIVTPFLVRVHNEPGDYTRWTELGMAAFLEDTGFDCETYSWGNEKCVIANFRHWERYKNGRDLRNQPDLPIHVWAYARPAQGERSTLDAGHCT
jgi:SAM-dependent methyltransferase